MASVEDRVVRMSFENAAFEKGVATTLGTIGSLNTALRDLGTKSGLADIQAADSRFSLPGVTGAVQGVSAGFAAMATVAITTLSNITNKAVDAGLSLAKSLTLAPIADGFAEYELNMNSIQTILANTRKEGAKLSDVNGALDELNAYSDQTIYNFAQMTKNIGSATAAGVSLDTAVTYVKGFANSAAVAGVDASAMAGGLEQMSQALASGVIKAQDWISLEKRGLAGQVQQEAFYNMAKAMGTLADVPLDLSFSDWTAAGNTLRGSLADGWLTAEVFTNTMGVFAGEMSDAELAALGFNEAMIAEARELGQVAIEAATKIRTGSQLLDVLKESVASGWSVSFRTVFGDFEEATELFSNLGNALTGMVGRSSDARNKMLQDWKDLGGRTDLIEGLRASFASLANVFNAVRSGFRAIFPKKTGEDLARYTERFKEFALAVERFTSNPLFLKTVTGIFAGLFSVLKIGTTVIFSIVKGVGLLLKAIIPLGGGGILTTLQRISSFVREIDADAIGENIIRFFEFLAAKIAYVMPYIREVYDVLFNSKTTSGAFDNDSGIIVFLQTVRDFALAIPKAFKEIGTAVANFVSNLDFSGFGEFFGGISDAASNVSFDTSIFDNTLNRIEYLGAIWDKILDGFGFIQDIGNRLQEVFSEFFSGFGGSVEEAVKESSSGDWDKLFDGIAVVFFGGLAAAFVRFLNKGFDINLDVGGGLFSSVKGSFDKLTKTLDGVNGVLKGMQADLKATALLKIAAAIGVLAIAIIALSFVDPKKLATATAAIAVGFGELAGALAILQRIEFSATDAAKMGLMAIAFGILAGALVILGLAMKIYATMSWEEIARGTAVLTAAIGSIIAMSKFLGNEAKGMIKASFAMLLLSLSMGSMFKVIKKFGELDMPVLIQGFIGVATAMTLLVTTMNLLPDDLERKTAGLLGFGLALNLMVGAIYILGGMDTGKLVQGGIALAGTLGVMVAALRLLPKNVGVMATQFLGLAGAIAIMAVSLQIFGSMSWEEMGRGLLAMAGSMAILVAGLQLAQGGLTGALAIIIISGAMLVLSTAIAAFAAIGFETFAVGIALMAAGIGVLAGVAFLIQPALPALLLLGAALALIGIGIGAIGFGAAQVAKALLIMVKVGQAGSEAFVAALETLAGAIPTIMAAAAKGLLEFIKTLGTGIPMMVELGIEILLALLDGLEKVLPDIFDFISSLISELLTLLVEKHDEITQAGIDLLKNFLAGLGENIGEVVNLVANIIVNFLDAFTQEIPRVVEALVAWITTIFTTFAEAAGQLMFGLAPQIAAAFISGMIQGITDGVSALWTAFLNLLNSIKDWVLGAFGIASPSTWFADVGRDLLAGLLNGIVSGAEAVWSWFTALPGVIAGFVADIITWLFEPGVSLLTGFWEGIQNYAPTIILWLTSLPGKILGWIGSLARTLFWKGWELLRGLYNGFLDGVAYARDWLSDLPNKLKSWVGSLFTTFVDKGHDLLAGLYNGIINNVSLVSNWLSDLSEKIKGWVGSLYETLKTAGKNLIIGLWNGINDKVQWVIDLVGGIAGRITSAVTSFFKIGSPSRVFFAIGQYLLIGLGNGIVDASDYPLRATDDMAKELADTMLRGYKEINSLAEMLAMDASPVIKPIVDLTQAQKAAKDLKKLLPDSSTSYAAAIASAQAAGRAEVTDHTSKTPEIKFEQTINAPKQLSTGDIYRQTRNQITMAKDELSIP